MLYYNSSPYLKGFTASEQLHTLPPYLTEKVAQLTLIYEKISAKVDEYL